MWETCNAHKTLAGKVTGLDNLGDLACQGLCPIELVCYVCGDVP